MHEAKAVKRKKIKADLKGRAMAWLFLVCSLLLCLLGVALNADYYRGALRYDLAASPPGLREEDKERIAQAIAASMNGDVDALRLRIVQDGREQDAFHAYEIAHMADVAGLFRLVKWVLWGGAALLAALMLASWLAVRRGKDPARTAKGMLIGVAEFALLIVAVAIWAAVDFHSVFWAFHQVAFTNELWLLDPATDLLIQLMPLRFFEETVLRVAGLWALCVAAWCAIAALWYRASRQPMNRRAG